MPHKFNNSITADRLRYLFDYDPETGIFRRKRGHRKDLLGAVAGCKVPQGYIVIRIDGQLYRSSRLAWLYCTGIWPANLIDHVDGNRSNDAFSNLREATSHENNANKKYVASQAGFKGVYINRRGRFIARLTSERRNIYLGSYKTPAEAAAAYNSGAIKIFGNFAKLNQV